jgi:hypothetical protein
VTPDQRIVYPSPVQQQRLRKGRITHLHIPCWEDLRIRYEKPAELEALGSILSTERKKQRREE